METKSAAPVFRPAPSFGLAASGDAQAAALRKSVEGLGARANGGATGEEIASGVAGLVGSLAIAGGESAQGSPVRLQRAHFKCLLDGSLRVLPQLSPAQAQGWMRGLASGLRLQDAPPQQLQETIARLVVVLTDRLPPVQLGACVLGLREAILQAGSLTATAASKAFVDGVVGGSLEGTPRHRFAIGCGLGAGLGRDEHACVAAICAGSLDEALSPGPPLSPGSSPASPLSSRRARGLSDDGDDGGLLLGLRAARVPWAARDGDELDEACARECTAIAAAIPHVLGDACIDELERAPQSLPPVRTVCILLATDASRHAAAGLVQAMDRAQDTLRDALLARLRAQRERVLWVFEDPLHASPAKAIRAMWEQLEGVYELFAREVLAASRECGGAPLGDSIAWRDFLRDEVAWSDELAHRMHAGLDEAGARHAGLGHLALRALLQGWDELVAERS